MIGLRPGTAPRGSSAFRPGAALAGILVGVLLGVAVAARRGRRGDDVRSFLDEVGRAARDALAGSGRKSRKKVLAPAADRLRALRNRTRNGWSG